MCPFYGDVAAIWSMLIRSILHKRGADFKTFWSYSGHTSKVLITLIVVECSQVRQLERKKK